MYYLDGVAIQLDLNMAHLISNISKMTIAFILDFAYSFTSASGYGSISDVTSCSIVVILLPFILVISEIFFRYSSVSSVLPQYVTPAVTSTVTLSNNFSNVKQIYRTLMEETQTRQILIFVVINFSFMFVEFTYGLATNSLSLISDSGHMFIDCMGLVIGLYAAYLAKLKPNDKYTFGYLLAVTFFNYSTVTDVMKLYLDLSMEFFFFLLLTLLLLKRWRFLVVQVCLQL